MQGVLRFLALSGSLAASMATANANADTGTYARFAQTTDTIRVMGNTFFAQGDFTYEARIRFVPGSPRGSIVWEQRDGTEDKNLQLGPSGDYLASGCAGPSGNITGNLGGIPGGEWIHLAYVHEGNTLKFYIDGILRETRTFDSCYSDPTDSWMAIGMFRQQSGFDRPSFLGDLDWLRISGSARYSGNFNPPLECDLVPDAQTQLLLKFNEAAGTAVVFDESPNHYLCQVGVHVQAGAAATSPSLGNTAGGFPVCTAPCPGDISQDGTVNGVDLSLILAVWGTDGGKVSRADANGDGIVDAGDLSVVLAGWGPCPD